MPTPRQVNWAKFRVLVVIAVSLSILLVLFSLLTGGTLFKAKAELRSYFQDTAGLQQGAPVRINGVLAGKVDSIHLSGSSDPNRVIEVRMVIQHEFMREIPRDSQTLITSENMLGDRYIEITKGRSTVLAEPGAELAQQPIPEMMERLDMAQFEAKLKGIDELLAEIEGGQTRLGQFVRGDRIYEDTRRQLARLHQSIQKATSAESMLGRLVYTDTAYESVIAPIRKLDAQLASIETGSTPAGRLLRDPAAHDDLLKRFAEIRNMIADLNAGKGAGGAMLQKDDLYRNWNERVTALIRVVDDLNAGGGAFGQAFTSAHLYETLNGSAREAAAQIKDFREDPRKYLRIKIF